MQKIILFILAVTSLSACSTQFTPRAQHTVDITDVDFTNIDRMKMGEDCSFGMSPQLKDAISEANIKQVKLIDYEYTYYVFAQKECVTVYGD